MRGWVVYERCDIRVVVFERCDIRGVYERGDIMGWCMRGMTLGGGV